MSQKQNPVDATPVTMPVYQSHKLVQALQIRALSNEGHLVFEDQRFKAKMLERDTMARIQTMASRSIDGTLIGGFYMVYEDGYESWSPMGAFVNGYTHKCEKLAPGFEGEE